MASITASEVIRDEAQANGFRYVEYRYTLQDNDLIEVTLDVGPLYANADLDTAVDIVAREPIVLESLDVQEQAAVMAMFPDVDPLPTVNNPKWSTNKKLARPLIFWMMDEQDVRIVLWLENLLVQVNALTDTQIKNFLDITQAQLDKMRARVKDVLNDPSVIKSGKTIIGEYEAEREVWE